MWSVEKNILLISQNKHTFKIKTYYRISNDASQRRDSKTFQHQVAIFNNSFPSY